MHHCPTTGSGWPVDNLTHSAQPPLEQTLPLDSRPSSTISCYNATESFSKSETQRTPTRTLWLKGPYKRLETEILHIEPLGGAVTEVTPAVSTANLNSCICSCGLSSREMWCQHDQFSNCQLPMSDHELIARQHNQRLTNHPHSAKSKAPLAQPRPTCRIEVGDLVYIHSDRNKLRARDRYLVTKVEGAFCHVWKFVGSQLHSTSYRVTNS